MQKRRVQRVSGSKERTVYKLAFCNELSAGAASRRQRLIGLANDGPLVRQSLPSISRRRRRRRRPASDDDIALNTSTLDWSPGADR